MNANPLSVNTDANLESTTETSCGIRVRTNFPLASRAANRHASLALLVLVGLPLASPAFARGIYQAPSPKIPMSHNAAPTQRAALPQIVPRLVTPQSARPTFPVPQAPRPAVPIAQATRSTIPMAQGVGTRSAVPVAQGIGKRSASPASQLVQVGSGPKAPRDALSAELAKVSAKKI